MAISGPERTLDLAFSVDADNLGLLAEGARGTLHARGRISGSSGAPLVKLTAQGTDLQHDDVKIEKLAANVDVDWHNQHTSHADVAISRLTVDERELTQFNAVLDGTTADHVFKIDALAARNSLHLSGKGGFTNEVWNATIADLVIDDAANLNLQLDAPTAVSASAQSFKLGSLCLHGKVARLCGEATWTPAAWNARAEATNLPISTLTAGLTPKVEYQGTVSASARLSGSGDAPFVGEARADLADAAIRHKLASGRTDVISFGSGFVTLKAEPDHMNGELRLDAASRGLIAGRLRAERGGNDMMDWPMRAQLQMATGELGFITLYVPDIDRAAGHFDANMSFDGTLGQPRASGVIKLSNAELDFYQLNLAMRALEAEARIVSNNLEFSATGKAGAGSLSSSGKDRVARGQAVRRHQARRREPAHGRCSRGTHRRLARPGLPHRRRRGIRQRRGQGAAGTHPPRRSDQCRAALGRRGAGGPDRAGGEGSVQGDQRDHHDAG
jgi:autotransporter translocation and assembly factor TamB